MSRAFEEVHKCNGLCRGEVHYEVHHFVSVSASKWPGGFGDGMFERDCGPAETPCSGDVSGWEHSAERCERRLMELHPKPGERPYQSFFGWSA